MDSEIRVQALRGAAGAKTTQCTQVRRGNSKCLDVSAFMLFSCLKSMRNKGWVRPVPAAAVIPAAQAAIVVIGSKASVAGQVNP